MDEARDFLMDALEYDDALAHYGTEGMEWGKRRYQYEDGSLTPLGRIHYGIGKRREKKESLRVKKVEKLARSGDVDKILKNRKLFTREEMQDALTRAQNMERARETGKSAKKKAESEKKKQSKQAELEKRNQPKPVNKNDLEAAEKKLKTIRQTMISAVGIYTAYNAIAKSINEVTGEKTLPRFDQESFKNWKTGKDKAGFDTSKSTVFRDSSDYYDAHGTTGGYTEEELKGMQTYSFPKEKAKKEKQPKWEQVKTSPFDQQASSSSRTSDDVINMYFDAVTGSYGADRTDWASAMNTKLKAIEMDFTPGVRKKR